MRKIKSSQSPVIKRMNYAGSYGWKLLQSKSEFRIVSSLRPLRLDVSEELVLLSTRSGRGMLAVYPLLNRFIEGRPQERPTT